MFAAPLFLRRPPRIRWKGTALGLRYQHDHHGPHKEYFQNPSQYPPSLRPDHGTTIATATATAIATSQPSIARPASSVPKTPSRIRRLIRTSLLIDLFLLLGWIAGTAVITWEYIQPPYAPDSEEHQELQEDIDELLETSPIVENFRDNEWNEEPIIRSRSSAQRNGTIGGQQMVEDTLSGAQGITMKLFRHPTMHVTALIFFAGFGLERCPDTLHAGAIATVMSEAYNRHMQLIMQEDRLTPAGDAVGLDTTNLSFFVPVRPGEVYTVMIVRKHWGVGQDTDTGECYIANSADCFLLSGDSIPMLKQMEDSEHPDETVTAIDPAGGTLHAMGTTEVFMKTDRVVRAEGESAKDYLKRVSDEAQRIEDSTFVMNDLARYGHEPPPTKDDK